MQRLALFALALSLSMTGACLRKPKQDYTVDQIAAIPSLEEIMRVQAQTMDPLFAKRSQTSFTDEEYTTIKDAAGRLSASSTTVKEKFSSSRPADKAQSFGEFAGKLASLSADLAQAAEAKDAAKTSATLSSMKETCKGCHKAHR